MKPLSLLKRRLFLIFLTIAFCVFVPIALLYAAGYTYKAGYGIVRTGSIFLSVPYADAVVSVNGNEIGRTGFLKKSFYIPDLAPSGYAIHVSRDGFYPWYRTIVVDPLIVSDTRVVLVPEDLPLVKLKRGGAAATSTRVVSPALYDEYLAAFKEQATTSPATRTSANDLVGARAVVRNGDVFVTWEAQNNPPSNFCGRPSHCIDEITIERGKQTAMSVIFFSHGVIYATREGGVYFSEVDARPTAVTAPIFPYAPSDVRMINGALIVKSGTTLYELDPF